MSIKKISIFLWIVIFGVVLSICFELALHKDTSRETLNEYLLSVQNNNVDKAAFLSTDERFGDKEEQKNFLYKVSEDKDDKIKSFKVLNEIKPNYNQDDSVILAEIEFGSGEVVKRGFKVKKDQYEGYRVVISSIKSNEDLSADNIDFGENQLY